MQDALNLGKVVRSQLAQSIGTAREHLLVDLAQTGGDVSINSPDNTASPIELKDIHCKKGKKQSVHLHFRGIRLQKSDHRAGAAVESCLRATLGPGSSGRSV